MKNIKIKLLLVTFLVCLLPIIPGIILWNKLPQTMAIHFNINNVADNFAPKWFVVFGLPALMAVLQFVSCVITDNNAKKHKNPVKLELITKWTIPVLAIVLQAVTLGYSLGYNLDIRRIVISLVGVMFVATGNYMPKLDYVKNKNISPQNAKKINRFAGILTVVMGLAAIVTVFLPAVFSVIWLVLLIPYTLACVVYVVKNR